MKAMEKKCSDVEIQLKAAKNEGYRTAERLYL